MLTYFAALIAVIARSTKCRFFIVQGLMAWA
jgi:hypothetical protein